MIYPPSPALTLVNDLHESLLDLAALTTRVSRSLQKVAPESDPVLVWPMADHELQPIVEMLAELVERSTLLSQVAVDGERALQSGRCVEPPTSLIEP